MGSKKGLGIRGKLIVAVVPVVLASLVIVTMFNSNVAKKSINEEIEGKMTETLNGNLYMVDGKLEKRIDFICCVPVKDRHIDSRLAVYECMPLHRSNLPGGGYFCHNIAWVASVKHDAAAAELWIYADCTTHGKD